MSKSRANDSKTERLRSEIRKIRSLWQHPDDRRILDPLPVVAGAILCTSRKGLDECVAATARLVDGKARLLAAVRDYQSVSNAFLEKFYVARQIVAWMSAETGSSGVLTVKDLSQILKMNPEMIYNAMARTLGRDYLNAMQHARDCVCPVCGRNGQ